MRAEDTLKVADGAGEGGSVRGVLGAEVVEGAELAGFILGGVEGLLCSEAEIGGGGEVGEVV